MYCVKIHAVNHKIQQIPYRGMASTAVGIVREEGTLKLWRGVLPALYRHVVYRLKSNLALNLKIKFSKNIFLLLGVRIAIY